MKRVRFIFYTFSVVIYILFSVSTSFIYLTSMRDLVEANAAEAYDTAYTIRKENIYYAVNNIVVNIDQIRSDFISRGQDSIRQLVVYLEQLSGSEANDNAEISDAVERLQMAHTEQLEIAFLTNDLTFENYEYVELVELRGRNLYIALPHRIVYENTLKETRALLHRQAQMENGYIWVNEIYNWSGGDNYAQRIIYPGKPETEGMMLTTNNGDNELGNSYQMQLDGLRDSGEVYFTYQYEKPGSTVVARKISYAKLYEPYNWAISTGVYLDDIETQTANAITSCQERQNEVVNATLLGIVGFAAVALISIILLERFYFRRTSQHFFQTSREREEFRRMAYEDKLTMLANRRSMEEILNDALHLSQNSAMPFGIVMLDLDDFKRLNDKYGHEAGDLVLRELGSILRGNVRPGDAVGRWGGEEFLLVLPGTSQRATQDVASRIRQQVESYDFVYQGEALRITASFGVSVFLFSDKGTAEVVRRADEALYESKRLGKNRVTVWSKKNETASPVE